MIGACNGSGLHSPVVMEGVGMGKLADRISEREADVAFFSARINCIVSEGCTQQTSYGGEITDVSEGRLMEARTKLREAELEVDRLRRDTRETG